MDGSVAFARFSLCPLSLIHACLGPPKSTYQTASRSVQPFLHRSRQRITTLYNGPPISRQNFPLRGKIWTSSNTPNTVPSIDPKSTTQTTCRSIQPFCWSHDHDRPTDRQTDRPRYSVCSNRPHLASAAMRSKRIPILPSISAAFNCRNTSTRSLQDVYIQRWHAYSCHVVL